MKQKKRERGKMSKQDWLWEKVLNVLHLVVFAFEISKVISFIYYTIEHWKNKVFKNEKFWVASILYLLQRYYI